MRIKALILSLVCLSATGCLYKPDLHQGNVITQEALDQLEMGMSKEQTIALLGSPLLADPFHVNRWDYYNYSKTGKKRSVEKSNLSLTFEQNQLVSIVK